MREHRDQLIERFGELWTKYRQLNDEIQEKLSWHRRNGGRLAELNDLRRRSVMLEAEYAKAAEELWARL